MSPIAVLRRGEAAIALTSPDDSVGGPSGEDVLNFGYYSASDVSPNGARVYLAGEYAQQGGGANNGGDWVAVVDA